MKIEFTNEEWQEIRFALADEYMNQIALTEAAKKCGWEEINDIIELRQKRIKIIKQIQKKIYKEEKNEN